MTPFAIRTEDLTRDFKTVRAVERLTLTIPPGIVFGFLGPNGAGKTTTIHLLLGLLTPTHGRAEIFGQETRSHAAAIRAQCGALLEHPGLYERLSAEDNLDFYARVWRLTATDRVARIKELLTHFGLWERRTEVVSTWSRGMKQKLAVARALLHRPALIFLDEPTAGLDPVAAASLRDDLAALVAHAGTTVFLTTHNLTEAEKLCQQVAVIRHGKLLAVGSPEQLRVGSGGLHAVITGRGFNEALLATLRARPEVAAANAHNGQLTLELREAQAELAPLIAVLVEAGAAIEEIRKGQASLEDVFLTLVDEEASDAH